MRKLILSIGILLSSAAMADDLSVAKELFTETVKQEVAYEIKGINFTTARDTGITPRGGGTEYYLVAWTEGAVSFKCDGFVVVRNGVAEEIYPNSFPQLCVLLD